MPRTIHSWMLEKEVALAVLIERAQLDARVVKAIVEGRFTPSPEQRRRLAAALGIEVADVAWGHANPVEHLYGHGPQFGRTP